MVFGTFEWIVFFGLFWALVFGGGGGGKDQGTGEVTQLKLGFIAQSQQRTPSLASCSPGR